MCVFTLVQVRHSSGEPEPSGQDMQDFYFLPDPECKTQEFSTEQVRTGQEVVRGNKKASALLSK